MKSNSSLMSSLLCATLALSFLPSCGPVNDVAETKDTVKKMSNTTEVMRGITDDTRKSVESSWLAARIRECSAARDEARAQLKQPELSANERVLQAGKYIKSFDFQIYKGSGIDNADVLQLQFKEALKEFQRVLDTELEAATALIATPAPAPLSYAQIDPFSKEANNLKSLALALKEVNIFQEIRQKQDSSEPVTLFGLIAEALQKSSSVFSGAVSHRELLGHEQIVIENVDQFSALLSVRANALAQAGLGILLKDAAAAQSSGVTPTKLTHNPERLFKINALLSLSLETLRVLQASNLKAELGATVKTLITKSEPTLGFLQLSESKTDTVKLLLVGVQKNIEALKAF